MRRALWLVALALFLLAPGAGAHDVGLSRGTYVVDGARIQAELVLADRELGALDDDFDRDDDGKISQSDLDAARSAIEHGIVARIELTGDGNRCPGRLVSVQRTAGDAVRFEAEYTCAAPPRRVELRVPLLDDVWPHHSHVASIAAGDASASEPLNDPKKTLALEIGAPPAPPAAPSFLAMLAMGIEHIVFGYDHLVFLVGLVLVGGRFRDLLWVVTAFTLAHSVTLALAALGVWAPSGRFVEPAIALSIAYVGVENFFVTDAAKRWRITLPFGLIHGFGFAGALAEVELPRADVPVALVAFNLGVELGQLAVMAAVVPVVMLLHERPFFREKGVKALNCAIVLAGLVWFVLRVSGL
jgi:hydrogenase/urease accessory protein HupE